MSKNARDQALSQLETIFAMVDALNVDYDRLEELRDLRNTPRYVAGWNMAGFMPDNEPEAFDNFEDAHRYILAELKEREEQAESEDEVFSLMDFAEDVNLESGEFSATHEGYTYWVTMDGSMLDESADDIEELAELEDAAGDCESQDEARERIQDDPLSIELRSDWGDVGSTLAASEARIVLCTGGPHVEILCDLDRGQPSRPRVIYKDWGTSGELFDFDRDAVLTYLQEFYFGE